jgi:hypothetical protein
MSLILISSICSRELTTSADFTLFILKASAILGTKALSKTPGIVLLTCAGFVNGPSILNIVLSGIDLRIGIINFMHG